MIKVKLFETREHGNEFVREYLIENKISIPVSDVQFIEVETLHEQRTKNHQLHTEGTPR